MSRSQEWNWGKQVMKQLCDALWCELELTYSADGCVAARYSYGSRGERFWFDPRDGFLHFITTMKQPVWTTPLPLVKGTVERINRRILQPGYFTVEPGWGITYRTCISMLPQPEDWQLSNWYTLWDNALLYLYHEMLVALPSDPGYCRTIYEWLDYLDRFPKAKVYLSGDNYRKVNRKAVNGVY